MGGIVMEEEVGAWIFEEEVYCWHWRMSLFEIIGGRVKTSWLSISNTECGQGWNDHKQLCIKKTMQQIMKAPKKSKVLECFVAERELDLGTPELKYFIELSKPIEDCITALDIKAPQKICYWVIKTYWNTRKSFLLYHSEQSKKQENKQQDWLE